MKSLDIRKKFFNFFHDRGHEIVPSSSLIPADDPTLLFANAGMNQFKDLFLGKEKRSYTRATTIQKCVRAGGKHNDLDNVGFTKRHLTFFEMMGNFSFGDYFKKDAIRYAWDFLTKEVGIPTNRLVATVFKTDDEAYNIWHKDIGLPENRIFRCGEKDNFWAMGDTGPCGPCSEILYDRNPESTQECTDPNADDERFLEIWNNVFMQFDRQKDGTLVPLKQTGVDTGMGLERLCLVLQEKDSVYETDLLMPIIKKIENLTGLVYEKQPDDIRGAFRVLADHARSSSLIIADGCTPSNEGRGYVLRKIIRRAALFDQKISQTPIFPQLVDAVIEIFGEVYSELKTHRKLITALLKTEVNKFAENLVRGKNILDRYFEENKNTKKITGEQAFKLYDTYGFPYEVTNLVAQEHGYTVDHKTFNQLMEKQRVQSGQKTAETLSITIDPTIVTNFTGYDELESSSTVTHIIKNNTLVDGVQEDEECWIIPQNTSFYVERGGQASDEGTVIINNETVPALDLKQVGNAVAIKIYAPCAFKIGQKITQIVDRRRTDTMRNHTATHLLQAALMKFLGVHIKQAGSLVTSNYLRFDFNYHENLSAPMVKEIEEHVNKIIWQNIPVLVKTTTFDQAKKDGVIAHFEEKYNPECVRVVSIDGVSKELCGGTHVASTGTLGCFKITDVTAVSAGMRRISAVTGTKALELFQMSYQAIRGIGQELKVPLDDVFESVEQHIEHAKELNKKLKTCTKQLIKYQAPQLLKNTQTINNIDLVLIELKDLDIQELRDIVSELAPLHDGLLAASSTSDTQCSFVISIPKKLEKTVDLKALATHLQDILKIRGGGSSTIIQGGGAIEQQELNKTIVQWLKNRK